ncbi:MAG: A/G-specific adenine glycosylase [Simkaniaceae bacterium]
MFKEVNDLVLWFTENKRQFPWREDPTPYAVWISEVMLQQTKASTVVPFFLRWMKNFPTLQHLAGASKEEVIKAWEGLGYYSRVRNLHKAAKQIMAEHQGEIPQEEKILQKLPGFGPYTTNAVLTFAFGKKAAPVDANVARVISRYFRIKESVAKEKTKKDIQRLALKFIPEENPRDAAEALIELGALICHKKPLCDACPLKAGCQAYKNQETLLFPVKPKKKPQKHLTRTVGVFLFHRELLLSRGKKGVMEDLWQFPYVEGASQETEQATQNLEKHFPLNLRYLAHLEEVSHSFTNFKVRLVPILYQIKQKTHIPGYVWQPIEKLKSLPFCSGHRNVLTQVIKFQMDGKKIF